MIMSTTQTSTSFFLTSSMAAFPLVTATARTPTSESAAAVESATRLVERHVAALELVNDLFKLLQSLLEAHFLHVGVGRGVGHVGHPRISRNTWAAVDAASPFRS
jgi:hypothetical protein